MIRINGVPLDNPQLGWLFRPESVPYSGIENQTAEIRRAGRDGLLPAHATANAPIWPLQVQSPPKSWTALQALFTGQDLVITRDDEPDLEVHGQLVTSGIDKVWRPNRWIDATFYVRLMGVSWRSKSVSTFSRVLSFPTETLEVFPAAPGGVVSQVTNLFTNPSFESGSGTVDVPWSAIAPLRTITRTNVAVASGYITDTVVDVEPGTIIRASVDWDSTDPNDESLFGLGARKDGVWDASGTGVTNWGGSSAQIRWIGPVYSTDKARRVKHFLVPEGVTQVQFSHYRQSGSGLFSYTLSVHVLGDPDFEVTYETDPPEFAAPTNGESTLTGVAPAGVIPRQCLAVRSKRWAKDGEYSLRLIPDGSLSNNTYADLGDPVGSTTPKNSTVTVAATRHLEAPLTGSLLRAGCASVYDGSWQSSPALPNTAGDGEVRVTGATGATGPAARPILHHGGSKPTEHVWWDLALSTEGTYDGPWFSGASVPASKLETFTWDGIVNGSPSTHTVYASWDGGMSAPIQDGVVRVKGAASGIQLTDSSGAWLTLPDIPAGEYVRFDMDTGRAWHTTTETWFGGTEVSGQVDFGGPRGVFEITPVMVGGDPDSRKGVLTVTTVTRSGAEVAVRGKDARLI